MFFFFRFICLFWQMQFMFYTRNVLDQRAFFLENYYQYWMQLFSVLFFTGNIIVLNMDLLKWYLILFRRQIFCNTNTKYRKSMICSKLQKLINCKLKTLLYFNWFHTNVKSYMHNQVLQLLSSHTWNTLQPLFCYIRLLHSWDFKKNSWLRL